MSFFYVPNFPKRTTDVDFLGGYSTQGNKKVIDNLNEMTEKRKKLVELLCNREASIDDISSEYKGYISLLQFLNVKTAPVKQELKEEKKEEPKEAEKKEETSKETEKKEKGKETEKKESKDVPLSRGCCFSWTNVSRNGKDVTLGGVDFEIASVKFSYGLWLIEKAQSCSLDQDTSKVEQNQKLAFQCLQKAAGFFQEIEQSPYELPDDSFCDLRLGVVKALHFQCLASAQTIVIERAEVGKQSEILIAGLCRSASDNFLEAKNSVTSPNPNPKPDPNKKWLYYLDYCSLFYQLKSYFYQGVHLSQPELTSIGKSVKILTEVASNLEKCRITLRNFMETPPTSNRYKDATISFNDFQQKSTFAHDKIKKENEMVYFEKVPDQVPEMVEAKQNAQEVKPEEVELDKSKWTDDMVGLVHSKQDQVESAQKSSKETREQSTQSQGCCTIL